MRLIAAAVLGLSAAPDEARMAERQVAALTEMVRAVNAGDAAAYARLYDVDATITIPGSPALEGRRAIEDYEKDLLREFPGARLGFYAVWQHGPVAAVHYAVNGRTPAGRSMGHEGLLFYRFLPSGLIADERRYLDSLTPMAQLGALGPVPARPLPTLPGGLEAHTATGSPSEGENVALVRASLAALDSKDEGAFLAGIADDAVLDELIEPQPSPGRRNVGAWFERWTRAIPDARSEITGIFGAGAFVLVELVVSGTLDGPLGPIPAANKRFAVHRAAIFQVKGGRLAGISAFMNGKEIAQAVGRWPPPLGK